MAGTLKSIADIFERKLFRIPDYQRGYAWEERQLIDFWDDLERLIEGKAHYTGLLTIRKANLAEDDKFGKWKEDKWLIESGFEPYYIVDGQQRMTTIIIFIQSILNRIKDNEMLAYNRKETISEKYIKRQADTLKSYIFGYEFNDPSNRFIRANVFKDEDDVYVEPMTIYTNNLENARKFFKSRLASLPHGELDKYYKKLTLKLQFNVYEIEDELDEFVVFETTNNRGKPLSKLELLKNRLIYITTILPNKSEGQHRLTFEIERKSLRLEINNAWKDIYEYLGKNELNLLDDDDFLRNHYYMYYGYDTEKAADYDKILLDEKFTSKDAQSGRIGIKDIQDYTRSIGKSSVEWFRVNNPEHNSSKFSEDLTDWLSKLQRQGFKPFFNSIMCLLLKKVDTSIILSIVKEMERNYFLVFDLSKRRNNTGISYFYQRSHMVWKGEKNAYDLLNDIKDRTSNSQIGFDSSMERFRTRVLEDLFNSADEKKVGYTGWTGLSYFLYEYEIFQKGKEDMKVDWRKNKNTIEHILPRSSEDPCWQKDFDLFDDAQKKILLNSLGNLLMLSRSKNSSQKNYSFEYKKRHEKNGRLEGYIVGSFSEIEVSQYKNWTADEIQIRGIKLLDFMESRWNIIIGDENRKKDLLYLDFL